MRSLVATLFCIPRLWHMKTPVLLNSLVGSSALMYLISYVVLFCFTVVAVVGIIITMAGKVTNGVGTITVTMPGAQKSINAASSR